jgi:hypothetical protein
LSAVGRPEQQPSDSGTSPSLALVSWKCRTDLRKATSPKAQTSALLTAVLAPYTPPPRVPDENRPDRVRNLNIRRRRNQPHCCRSPLASPVRRAVATRKRQLPPPLLLAVSVRLPPVSVSFRHPLVSRVLQVATHEGRSTDAGTVRPGRHVRDGTHSFDEKRERTGRSCVSCSLETGNASANFRSSP